jgi:hypothetical protein
MGPLEISFGGSDGGGAGCTDDDADDDDTSSELVVVGTTDGCCWSSSRFLARFIDDDSSRSTPWFHDPPPAADANNKLKADASLLFSFVRLDISFQNNNKQLLFLLDYCFFFSLLKSAMYITINIKARGRPPCSSCHRGIHNRNQIMVSNFGGVLSLLVGSEKRGHLRTTSFCHRILCGVSR